MLLRLGIPLAVQSVMIHCTQILCVSHVNAFGVAAAGASSIGKRIGRLINIMTSSVNQGAGSMIGQNLGAGKTERVCEIVKTTLLCAGACSLVAIVLAVFFPRECFSLFLARSDPNFEIITDMGIIFLHMNVLVFLMVPFQGAFQAVVTGCGNTRLVLLSGILDGIVLRLGISFLMAYAAGMGAAGFFLGDALAHLGPLTISLMYYRSGKWKTYRLLYQKSMVAGKV